ncbi:MAG: mechanosensitive ion channel family protein [Candidatus Acidiferrales bacterium]
MTLPAIKFTEFTLSNGLRLGGILLLAFVFNRLLRVFTNRLIRPAAPNETSRGVLSREQHTRTMAGVIYSGGTAIIILLAALMALPELGFSVTPLAAAAGLASLAIGFGAQNLVRDFINGFFIVFEEQFAVGDTIRAGAITGRVEHITLRRTVVRDPQGALVTIPNSDLSTVANLSRDWGQVFVDVTVPAGASIDAALAALDKVAAAFRTDAAWSAALQDGPRVLGIDSLTPTSAVLRLQIRTAPGRQDDIARELRRRILSYFEQEKIGIGEVHRIGLIDVGSGTRGPAPTGSQ